MSCRYNASSYENDIALVELKKLPFEDKCLEENPAISAVCVPWSTQLFQPNHTCSISGWGRTAGMSIGGQILCHLTIKSCSPKRLTPCQHWPCNVQDGLKQNMSCGAKKY